MRRNKRGSVCLLPLRRVWMNSWKKKEKVINHGWQSIEHTTTKSSFATRTYGSRFFMLLLNMERAGASNKLPPSSCASLSFSFLFLPSLFVSLYFFRVCVSCSAFNSQHIKEAQSSTRRQLFRLSCCVPASWGRKKKTKRPARYQLENLWRLSRSRRRGRNWLAS